MTSIKWDPRSNGFMLSCDPYENKLIYMHENPRGYDSRKHHRMFLWFWDYTTSTRTYLPPLYYQIYRAVIHKHILYVVAKGKEWFRIYSLDLKLEKNHEWEQLNELKMKHKGYDIKLIPFLQDSRKDDLIIVYEKTVTLYNPQTNYKIALQHDWLYTDEKILKVVQVGEKLCVIRETHLVIYNMESEETELEEHFDDYAGYAYENLRCQDACVHVYHDRYILIVCENRVEKNEKLATFWFVAVFDCKEELWLHPENCQGYVHVEYENSVYNEGISNFLWHENFLCLLHCERNEDDDLRLDHHITNATTIQYHISHFLPNMKVIEVHVLMRYLFDNNRATVKQVYQDTYEGMLFEKLPKELFQQVLHYLVCKKKYQGCEVFPNTEPVNYMNMFY